MRNGVAAKNALDRLKAQSKIAGREQQGQNNKRCAADKAFERAPYLYSVTQPLEQVKGLDKDQRADAEKDAGDAYLHKKEAAERGDDVYCSVKIGDAECRRNLITYNPRDK